MTGPRRTALVCGLILLAVAAIMGLTGIRAAGQDCGTAFSPDREHTVEAFGVDLPDDSCQEPIRARQRLLFLAAGLGLATTLAAVAGSSKS